MKAKLFFLAFVFLYTISFSQDIIIDFSGNGASNTIDNVIIENLSNGSTVTVPGDKAFNLTTGSVGIIETSSNSLNKIKTFPNPTYSNTNIVFNLIKEETINIVISDINGKNIINQSKKLYKGLNKIIFTPSKKGIYFVSISGKNFSENTKIINLNSNNFSSEIKFENISSTFAETKNKDNYDFSFTVGDIIKLTANSGNFTTIQTDAPTVSKTYNFEFVQCTDYDDNNYPVVQIGSQIWMARNLNVTHYPNGDAIPLISGDDNWAALEDNNTDDAYSYYNDNASGEEYYGALYTYSAAIADNWEKDLETDQGVCPTGWHVPSSSDWNNLVSVLGTHAGSKLANGSWTSGNLSSNNDFNTSGFNGEPFGRRYNNGGNSAQLQAYTYWWTTYEYNDYYTYARSLYYNFEETMFDKYHKSEGFYVRCIKND